jgi:hypothetical protein
MKKISEKTTISLLQIMANKCRYCNIVSYCTYFKTERCAKEILKEQKIIK